MDLAALLAQLRACRWVDLTHAFAPGVPHFAAFPDERRELLFDHAADGFQSHVYTHVGQWGTHMDPPVHFTAGGRTQDQIPVTDMICPLVVVDVSARAAADPDLEVTPDDLLAWEAEHGRIPATAFVALRTDWSHRWPDGDAMANRDASGVSHYPGWGVPALRLLVEERGVTAVGHETTDTDAGTAVSGGHLPAEAYVLGADRWQVELLTNLDQVPATGALVVATWPKPLGGSGFPARVFAVCPPAP